MILMMKDTKVLETNKDGSITIYEEKLLPFSLQKEDLSSFFLTISSKSS